MLGCGMRVVHRLTAPPGRALLTAPTRLSQLQGRGSGFGCTMMQRGAHVFTWLSHALTVVGMTAGTAADFRHHGRQPSRDWCACRQFG